MNAGLAFRDLLFCLGLDVCDLDCLDLLLARARFPPFVLLGLLLLLERRGDLDVPPPLGRLGDLEDPGIETRHQPLPSTRSGGGCGDIEKYTLEF